MMMDNMDMPEGDDEMTTGGESAPDTGADEGSTADEGMDDDTAE